MSTERSRTAYHEAGHAVITCWFSLGVGPATIEPDPDFSTLGTSQGESEWGDSSIDATCIVILYAGYAAEKRYDPDHDDDGCGCGSDNDKAAELLGLHPELSEAELRQETDALVEKCWPAITAVATALMEETTLKGGDIEQICFAIEDGLDWRRSLREYRGSVGYNNGNG